HGQQGRRVGDLVQGHRDRDQSHPSRVIRAEGHPREFRLLQVVLAVCVSLVSYMVLESDTTSALYVAVLRRYPPTLASSTSSAPVVKHRGPCHDLETVARPSMGVEDV